MSSGLRILKNAAARIIDRAVDDALLTEKESIQTAENTLVDKVVLHLLKEKGVAEELIIARRLSRGWLDTADQITVSANSCYVTLKPAGVDGSRAPMIPKMVIYGDKKIEHSNPLSRELLTHDERSKALAERRGMLSAKLRGVLSQCTTYGKLKALWPEGEPYWGPFMEGARAEQARRLPAVKIDEINSLLGLPKETSNAA